MCLVLTTPDDQRWPPSSTPSLLPALTSQVTIYGSSTREAPPETVELPADLVFSAHLYDLGRAYARTCGHVGGLLPPAAPKFRGSSPDRPCHSEVAGQGIACRLWSGCSRRYASGHVSKSPGPRSPRAGIQRQSNPKELDPLGRPWRLAAAGWRHPPPLTPVQDLLGMG